MMWGCAMVVGIVHKTLRTDWVHRLGGDMTKPLKSLKLGWPPGKAENRRQGLGDREWVGRGHTDGKQEEIYDAVSMRDGRFPSAFHVVFDEGITLD